MHPLAQMASAPQPSSKMALSPFGAPEVQGGAAAGAAAEMGQPQASEDRLPSLASSDRFDFLSKLIAGRGSDSLMYARSGVTPDCLPS
jgi:hypothetical protein